jgi:hypothetical protein
VHKAAQRGRSDICKWLLSWGSVGAEHLQADGEGFTPADLARLKGAAELCDWLKARQLAAAAAADWATAEAANDCATTGGDVDDDDDTQLPVGHRLVPETRFPPVSFYGAAAVGDAALLRRIMSTDPYYPNQDNGVGAPLHFAVAHGQADMVATLLGGGLGEGPVGIGGAGVNVNQRSRGGRACQALPATSSNTIRTLAY